MSEKAQLVVDGKKLAVSNLNKVLYPKAGFTKGQVIDYYIRIAPVLLPHLRDRPLTMKRYPNGVDQPFFYEKNCPVHRPSWVKTAKVWSEGNQRDMHYCLAQDLPTLVWAANLADIELHTSLARKKDVARPTMMVFDLDPGAPADIVQCCQVGLWLRDLLAEMKLKSWAKTSGSKGLQVYVPLNTAATFDQTKALSRALAEHLEREHSKLVISKMARALREGKVFVDWSQNDEHKT
ncbi:MAG: bifunctional non-ous end joining protein LigD, partial [Verrucomicrobiota bacterium]